MKKTRLLSIAILLGILIIPANEVFATHTDENDTKKNETQEEKIRIEEERLDVAFSDEEDTDLVLELPDGGIISGPGDFKVYDLDGNLIETYNIETDPNSVTVEEYKADRLESIVTDEDNNTIPNLGISLFGTSIPTKYLELDFDQEYKSNGFSGSGWRYGELFFRPAYGTGGYLRWTTYEDTANVCHYYGGNMICWPMDKVKTPYWFWAYSHDGINDLPARNFYQIYNPKGNPYYKVANRNW